MYSVIFSPRTETLPTTNLKSFLCFFSLFLILDFFLKDSIQAFSGLKEEIVSKPVIVKIGSIEVSGSYFALERFLLYPLTSIIFYQPVNVKEKNSRKLHLMKYCFRHIC